LTTFLPILTEAAAAVEHGIISSITKLQIIAMLPKFLGTEQLTLSRYGG
jgi:hypothetical protein